MKKRYLWMLAAILTCSLTIMGLGSCTRDNVDNNNGGGGDDEDWSWLYELSDVEFMESGYFSYYDLLWDIINDHSDQESYDDQLYYDWAMDYLDYLEGLYTAKARGSKWNDDDWGEFAGMNYVTIRYKTIGADGAAKELSELVAYPADAENDEAKSTLKNLFIGCHSTITKNERCPTNFKGLTVAPDVTMLALLGTSNKGLVVIPDYEGYGYTVKDPHPYCNRDLTAQQVIDGAKAAVVWYEANVGKMKSNWKSLAVGYSQGGAVAAGVLEYYYAHNLTGLNIIGALCGDGPYDPLATMKQYIKDDRLYMPMAAALMIKGMVDTNKEMKALGCTYRDFVTEKFYNTGIFDWLQEKAFTVNEIQTKLLEYSAKNGGGAGFTMMAQYKDEFRPYIPENIKKGDDSWELTVSHGYNYCTVDQCLRSGMIEYFKSGTLTGDVAEAKLKALDKALKENALTYGGWKPSGDYPHAYCFFHSTADEVVPLCNYVSVRDAWGKNLIQGQLDTAGLLHVATGASFFIQSGSIVKDILGNKWAPGEK